MKLTIILTVYNKEPFLDRAFNALLTQINVCEDDYEVLVVNDGSTDHSVDIIEKYALNDSRIRVLSQQNQGLSMARNNGVEGAAGDYVWFVDADDYISSNSVRLICDAMIEKPDVITIYSNTEGEDNIIRNAVPTSVKTGKNMLVDPNVGDCGVFNVLRKSFLIDNDLKFFPGIYHEDSEFTPRMLYLANKVVVIPEILYTVIHEPNSITQVPRVKRAFDCLIVADHLVKFAENEEMDSTTEAVFINKASVCINNAFNIIVKNNAEEQDRFNDTFNCMPHLIKVLMKSTKIKYRVEGLLFKISCGNYVGAFKLLKLFQL